MATSWTQAAQTAVGLLRVAFPSAGWRRWVEPAVAVTGPALDRWAGRTPAPDPTAVVDAELAVLRQRAAPASRYLQEEGSTPDTDCFSCSSAHLATLAGALRRAAQAAQQAGTCDPECQKWLALAVQEPGILLEHDWPDTKRWPAAQQAVVDRYRPQVAAFQQALLGGDEAAAQRQALLLAAAGLKEATRFTRGGDPVDHPEVERRRQRAEQHLATAERLSVTTFDDATYARLRRLRQAVGNQVATGDDLVRVAAEADTLARAVTADAWRTWDGARLQVLADQADALHRAYVADRRAYAERVLRAVRKQYEDVDTRIPDALATSFLEDAPDGADLRPLLGATPATERAIANLLRLEAARRVPVRVEPLPPLIENGRYVGPILGAYYPAGDVLYLGPQVLSEDAQDVATVAEETAHSLLHNTRCDIYPPQNLSYEEIPEEREAKAAVLLALLKAGVPFETDTGRRIDPAQVRVQADAALAQMDPVMRHRATWAADIMAQAIAGHVREAAAAALACPTTAPPASRIGPPLPPEEAFTHA